MGADFLDDKGIIKDNVTVLEKMRIKRTFPVSDNMKKILDELDAENRRNVAKIGKLESENNRLTQAANRAVCQQCTMSKMNKIYLRLITKVENGHKLITLWAGPKKSNPTYDK
jgi:hypothetical protein